METFPYTSLMDRLDGREIGLCDTEPREVLKILANVHRRRVASRGFSHDLKEFSGKVIHHHAAILAIPNLSRERMNLPASKTHRRQRSEEHTSELQSLRHLVCRLLLEKKKKKKQI